VPALEAFFGSGAGLSAPVITRLVAAWQADYETFCRRDLSDRDYVYCWADRVHFRVQLEQARLCCLVIVGMRADGHKELVASQPASSSTDAAGARRQRLADQAGVGGPARLPQELTSKSEIRL
jgi:putative transposase